jgi:hypothetical protein
MHSYAHQTSGSALLFRPIGTSADLLPRLFSAVFRRLPLEEDTTRDFLGTTFLPVPHTRAKANLIRLG